MRRYNIAVQILACCISLNINPLHAQDTTRTHLATLPTDSSRLLGLSETVNAAVHSNPEYTFELATLFDSIAQLHNSTVYDAKGLNLNGVAQHANGNYELALDYYIQALDLAETGNDKELLALIYSNMATCYGYRKETSKSIEYFKKAITICETIGDTTRLAQSKT